MRTTSTPPGAVRGRAAWRLSRALVVATVASCLAFAGHSAGGGKVPGPAVVLGVVLLAAAVSWSTSRARWSPRSLTGVLLLVQASVHLTCGLSASAGMESSMTRGMLAAHLVATAVSVAVLGRGEAVLLRLFETLLMRPIRVLDVVASPIADPHRVRPYTWVGRLHRLSFVSCEPTRGPPAAV